MKPNAGMPVLSGILYFFGTLDSSVTNQPPMLTATDVGLNNSMVSTCGKSVWVRTSLTTIGGRFGSGSSSPGDPPGLALARQFAPLSGACDVPGFLGTREKPKPSGATGQG